MSVISQINYNAEKFKDKTWRLCNLYYIKNKLGKKQKFNLNATQKKLNDSTSQYDATLKGRQQGVSTYYVLKYFDDAIFTPNTTVAIIAHKRDAIEKLFRIARYAYKYLPEGIKPVLAKGGGSKYELYFPEIESRIYVSLEVRSDAVQKLHISEYGLMKNKDAYDASIEALPLDSGVASIESTPMGLNHFYKDWVDPEWHFKRHFFPWFFHYENILALDSGVKIKPTDEEKILIAKAKNNHGITITKEQLNWRRTKIRQKSRDSFLVEHPEDDITCFMSSGTNPLNTEQLKNQLLEIQEPLRKVREIVIYEEFNKDDIYVCGADTAGGTGGDYYYGTVFRVRGWVQCAQVRGNRWKASEFASLLIKMCKIYTHGHRFPLLGVERNNHGHAVLLSLSELEHYPNLFYHDEHDEKLGWNTTGLTRHTLIDHFIEAVDNQILKIRSKELLGECLTLVDNKGKIEAQEGEHDDCVMGTAVAIQLLQRSKKLELWDNLGDLISVD